MTTVNGYNEEKILELMQWVLPKGAYKKHPTKSYLTTIDPDYTRERLTKIFGLYGKDWGLDWDTGNTIRFETETSGGKPRYHFAILKAEFWYRFGDEIISFPVTGHSDNDNIGDAMKGARTTCISDAAKQMLFQLHIYKNQPYKNPGKDTQPEESESKNGNVATKPNTQTNGKPQNDPNPWPAKSGPVAVFCAAVRENTPYYTSQWHLNNSLQGGFGDLSNTQVFNAKLQEALDHAKNKADEKAAQES